MKKTALLVAGVLSLITTPAISNDSLSSPEAAIEFRQQQFKTIQKSLKQMNSMLRGSAYSRAEFAEQAEQFAQAANQALDGFQVAGANQGDTKARPAVWENWDDFEKRMINFQLDARKLAAYAADGNTQATREAFTAASKQCKACHNKYRTR